MRRQYTYEVHLNGKRYPGLTYKQSRTKVRNHPIWVILRFEVVNR